MHAGNSSGVTDGAAALVLATEEEVRKSGVEPLARVVGVDLAGVEPARMGVGPVPAIRALLAKTKLALSDIDLIELNEAFAAQVIACAAGPVARPGARSTSTAARSRSGHPIGATGARIVDDAPPRDAPPPGASRGLATLCVSGGMGMAVLFER